MLDTAAHSIPVAIVGGGPVGLTLALFLDRFGVRSAIFNAQPAPRWHPKGGSESARSMELFRQLGLSDRIRALGLPDDHPTDVAYFTRFNGFELARLRMPSRAETLRQVRDAAKADQTPEPMHRANQMQMERLMFEHARSRPNIAVRYGWEVTDFAQDDTGVSVTAVNADDGTPERWRAQYLVGCDGGRSMVRRALGIKFRGESGLEERYFGGRMFSTYIRSAQFARLLQPRRAWQYWAVNPDIRSTVITIDGSGDFLFRSKAAAPNQPADDATITRVLRACAGEAVDIQIVGHEPWTAGVALVAERFADGRVFLAGDAAHLFTPTGGFGMNTGLDDASNLAWKLAACVQGWGGEGLLASYECERVPIALRNTGAGRQFSVNINDVHAPAALEDDSPAGSAARTGVGTQLAGFGEQFASIGVQLGARYDESPVIISDAPPPPDDLVRYRPSSIPGGRAPHLWLAEEHIQGNSLYDRCGLGMTLLRLGPHAPKAEAFAGAAEQRGLPLKILDIADPAARDLYGCDLALIRPDQYVAWRGNTMPSDPSAILARATGDVRR